MTLRAAGVTRVFGKGQAAVTAIRDVNITLEAGRAVVGAVGLG